MQRSYIPVALALVMICGCASPGTFRKAHIHNYALSGEDMDFAYALSAYSAGIAEEIRHGTTKGRSVDFFIEAARHDPDNYALARKAAVGLLYRRRASEAAAILEETSKRHPDNYRLLLDLATVYDIGDMPEKEQKAYELAIEAFPTNAAAYIASARSNLAAGKIDDALELLQKGVEQSDAGLMTDLALINAAALLRGGFPMKAVDWFLFVAEHSESSKGKMHLIVAEILEGQGKRDDALEQYELATRQKDAMPEAYLKLAMLVSENDQKSALAILDRGEQQFPMDDIILAAVVYMTKDNPDRAEAINLLNKFAARTDKKPTEGFYLHLGASYERSGKLDKAAQIFQKGIDAYPDSHEMMNYLAYMWAERSINLDKGKELTEKALKAEPGNGAYLDTLGWIYFMQGNNKQAIKYIRKALNQIPDDPTIIDHLGDILAKQGKIKEAIDQWKRSYRIDSSSEELKKKLQKHNALDAQPDQ